MFLQEFVKVAPRAGAWIEIHPEWWTPEQGDVAPRAGAWIEITSYLLSMPLMSASRPARARGLK